MTDLVKLLAKLLSKEVLVTNLEDAIALYKQLPVDDNFAKVAMCATLIVLKDSADTEEINPLLENMAANTIPFFYSSAN